MFPTHEESYYCRSGGHWMRKELARIRNNVPYCPECKKKLKTTRTYFKAENKEQAKRIIELRKIIIPFKECIDKGNCCAFCNINFNLEKRLKRFTSSKTRSQAQTERIRKRGYKIKRKLLVLNVTQPNILIQESIA